MTSTRRPQHLAAALVALLGALALTSVAAASSPPTRTYNAAAFMPRAELAPALAYDDGFVPAWNHPEAVAHHGPEVDNIFHDQVVRERAIVLEGNAWTPTGADGWMTLAGPNGSVRVPVVDGRFSVWVWLRPGENGFTLRSGLTTSRFSLRFIPPAYRPRPRARRGAARG